MGAQGISCALLPAACMLLPHQPSFTWTRHTFMKQVHPVASLHDIILRSVKGNLLATLLRIIPLEWWNGYFISLPYFVQICNESHRVTVRLPFQLRNLHELKQFSRRQREPLRPPSPPAARLSVVSHRHPPPDEQLLRLRRTHPEYCFLFLVSFQNLAVLEPSPDMEPFQALNSGLFTIVCEIIFSSFL